eukprot:11702083-Karenia_brevis.AAC.1
MAGLECTTHFYSNNNGSTGMHKEFLYQQQRNTRVHRACKFKQQVKGLLIILCTCPGPPDERRLATVLYPRPDTPAGILIDMHDSTTQIYVCTCSQWSAQGISAPTTTETLGCTRFLLQEQRQQWSAQGSSTPTTTATLECTRHLYSSNNGNTECTRHFYAKSNGNIGVHEEFVFQQQRQHWSAQRISIPTTIPTLEHKAFIGIQLVEIPGYEIWEGWL